MTKNISKTYVQILLELLTSGTSLRHCCGVERRPGGESGQVLAAHHVARQIKFESMPHVEAVFLGIS